MTQAKTRIEAKRFDEIQTWMSTGQGTDLPNVLQGIYFMDGNKLPDDCFTMDAQWDSDSLTLFIDVFAPLQWTFNPSNSGCLLLKLVQLTKLVYEIRFLDNTLRRADAIPTVLGLRLPRWIVVFEMNQTEDSVNGNTWERINRGFFRLIPMGGYILRKIVDRNGQKLPTFDQMLTKVQETCIVVENEET
ncbi:MAG: hypothetical protein AAF298_17765 [Cyanobacteria bacterium P01_A01_bin.40]